MVGVWTGHVNDRLAKVGNRWVESGDRWVNRFTELNLSGDSRSQ